ncbi:MAG: hypothetical protein HAW67_04220 [Endozoicomonadaceae bacterium]|nr:hypothetical protein [Endozoicomonadaceae bacterium]
MNSIPTKEQINDWSLVIDRVQLSTGNVFVLIDIETTGGALYCHNRNVYNRMLEVALVFYVKCERTKQLQPLLDNVQVHIKYCVQTNIYCEHDGSTGKAREKEVDVITSDMTNIHGITKDSLEGLQPRMGEAACEVSSSFSCYVDDMFKLIAPDGVRGRGDPLTAVMHNAGYDKSYLNYELARLDRLPIDLYVLVCDSWTMARRYLKKNEVDDYSLQSLYEYTLNSEDGVGRISRTLHSAETDVRILFKVFNMLLAKLTRK